MIRPSAKKTTVGVARPENPEVIIERIKKEALVALPRLDDMAMGGKTKSDCAMA
ncbi:MAG: hypothetical protein AAF982_02160 [Pseudomonadota bacterium]